MHIALIRHARTTPHPELPPRLWGLSEEGRRAAEALADLEALARVTLFASSAEPKAVQTAAAIARGRSILELDDLGELDRAPAGWLPSEAQQHSLIRAIFDNPDTSVQGCEPASQALARFVHAIDDLILRYPRERLGVVSHGTVLSLYMAHLAGRAHADFKAWRRLRLPDVAIVDPTARSVLRDFGC
jgi:broad specificity phosphatase PhoE